MALHGAAPPVDHGFAGLRALREGAINPALEQRGRGAVVVFEEQRLAKRHQEVDVVAAVEVADTRTVPSATRAADRSSGLACSR